MLVADLDTFTTFGEYLRYLRRRARLTQRELGIAVGYSDVQIARLEHNQRLPDTTTVRARFVEALGLERELALAGRLVELAEQAHGVSRAETSVPHARPNLQHVTNLPVQLTPFIGREQQMAEVQHRLNTNRLVTLTGSSGVGKTRLAIEAGGALLDQFSDGVWLIELSPLADPSLVPRIVAEVFGLQEQGRQALVQALVTYLEGRHTLLILDNCEHLIDACAHLAETLLRTCPHLRILATSREALRVPGEVAWRVPSLSTPDPANPLPLEHAKDYEAVRLFVQHATSVHPDFTLTQDRMREIVRICHRLDGIPLALELAAALAQALSPQEIAARLDDRFHLLASGSRTALPRHQTLRAALDWSYDLLSEPEQILFQRLAVFAGGWTAEAAEAVCIDPEGASESKALSLASGVLPVLLRLVDKSLVIAYVEPQASTTNGAVHGERTRYRMLETVRQYAAERLGQAGERETDRVHNRHLDYFLGLAQQIEAPDAPQQSEFWRWIDQVGAELDNFRAALAWSVSRPVDDERGLHLAWALESLWFDEFQGHYSEGRVWLAKALAKWTRPTADRAKALNVAGFLAAVQGEYATARAELSESVRLSRNLGDRLTLADALTRLASATRQLALQASAAPTYLEEAQGYLVEALSVARATGFQVSIAYALQYLGGLALMRAEPSQARLLVEEALAIFQRHEDKMGLACTLAMLANYARYVQDWPLARTCVEQCVSIARETSNRYWMVTFLLNLALVEREEGNYAQATRLYEECQTLAQQLRRLNVLPIGSVSRILIELGHTAQLQGDLAHAEALLDESVSVCRAADNTNELATALNALAAFSLARGDEARAARHYRESLRLSHPAASRFVIAVGLAGMAEVMRLSHQPERAARLCGAAAALGDIRGWAYTLTLTFATYTATDLLVYDRIMAAMRAQLGDPATAVAWAEGKRMILEQAVQYALAG